MLEKYDKEVIEEYDTGSDIQDMVCGRKRAPHTDNQLQEVQRSSTLCRRPLRKKPPEQIILPCYISSVISPAAELSCFHSS